MASSRVNGIGDISAWILNFKQHNKDAKGLNNTIIVFIINKMQENNGNSTTKRVISAKKLTFTQNLCDTASYPLALVKSYNVNVNITTIFPPMQLILLFFFINM